MGKASILIVDDDISLGRSLSLVLRHKGYAVTTAQGGVEALAEVKERPFDLVFMDIKMPVLNGVETYKKMKKVRPQMVVVMMTAYSVEALVQEALQEGAYGIIYKPLDIEKVIALIEKARSAEQGALILIVDDDPGICATLKNILSNQGYKVCSMSTGEEAITRAKKKDYDIIFIDMKLPTINGLETYLAIKKINPEAVAIMMTAYRQELADLMEEALNNSAYTCLYKPFEVEKMLRLIEEIQEKKSKSEYGGKRWNRKRAS
jgi:DNA-binding NtrC family response regulator